MIDENATQQGTTPWIVLENVSAAIVAAEELLNSARNVHDFNAEVHRSQEVDDLLQKSNGSISNHAFAWEQEHYDRAKRAIAPGGDGLGRRFIEHFMPSSVVPTPETLQSAILIHYQERWQKEEEKLLDEAQLGLWQAKETNDAEKMVFALELEKQAKVFLGKVQRGGVSRVLLEQLDSTAVRY